jgi:hypothetical protein
MDVIPHDFEQMYKREIKPGRAPGGVTAMLLFRRELGVHVTQGIVIQGFFSLCIYRGRFGNTS